MRVKGTYLRESQAANINVRESIARSSTRRLLLTHAWEGLESALLMLMVANCA